MIPYDARENVVFCDYRSVKQFLCVFACMLAVTLITFHVPALAAMEDLASSKARVTFRVQSPAVRGTK